MYRFAGWLAELLAGAFGFAALVQGVIFVQLAKLPFNALGRHFDDGVVHDAQALPVHGSLVVLFLGLGIACACLARWIGRRRRS